MTEQEKYDKYDLLI